MNPTADTIFNITSDEEFRMMALSVFRYQAKENKVYKRFIEGLKIDAENVAQIEQIPFLPVEFFKAHPVITGNNQQLSNYTVFSSSGTTGSLPSKHYVADIAVYEKSYRKAFELFYGNVEGYCILALLPSYLERDGSSLIYMARDLIGKSKHTESGFYLHNYEELIKKLNFLRQAKQKTLLLGVTYALLDLTEKLSMLEKVTGSAFSELVIMETGGMKGQRKEMVRKELHEVLCKGFAADNIHSEYGMTELLSQAYSKGDGKFYCPPWMRVLIRDTNDPFSYLSPERTGGINIIDLANVNSCSFISTQDLGKRFKDNSFEVLGRFDNSDIRGCNLLVQ